VVQPNHPTKVVSETNERDRSALFRLDSAVRCLSSLTSIPVTNLLVILVAMPLAATVLGWLLAGRNPAGIARHPLG
jgi:hypothetical protein